MPLPNSGKLIAFVATLDMKAAKAFYVGQLGLTVLSEDGFALALNVNGTMLRVTLVRELTPAVYTVLGWDVVDIAEAVRELQKAEIKLERFAGLEQDELGIWIAPGGGARVAWFKDPDGNVLSVSQHG